MTRPAKISFDGWTLHGDSGELERDGSRVRLQDLPFQILDELLGRPGEVVTREQLIARLWPKTIVDFDTNLNAGVRRLRAALHDDADAPRYIETLPRRGYRYMGPLPSKDVTVASAGAPAVAAATAPLRAMGSRASRTPLLAWLGVLGVLLIAAFAVFRSRPEAARPSFEPSRGVATSTRLRLAVLPFENLSPDPANAFFTDGMHEEILSTIANRAGNLEVISRTTMMVYRSTSKTVGEIARELGVTHVLEGSVRREGQTVRLTLQLIDARNDAHVWSKNFDAQLSNAMALQSAIAQDVSSQLAVRFSGNIAELPAPATPEAYDLYLKARLTVQTAYAARAAREQGRAMELLDRALTLDPSFAAAYLLRARVRMSRFTSSQDVSEQNLVALRADLAAARKVMGDSPPLLVTEAAYAYLVEFDGPGALRLLATAEAMNPHSSEVSLYVARALSTSGRVEEALAYHQRAAQLDPGNPTIAGDWAADLKMARHVEEALRRSRDFEARYPGLTTYGWRLFGFTAQLERVQRETALQDAVGDPDAQLAGQFELLRFSQRLGELAPLVEQSGLTTIRQASFGGFSIPAIGRKPVAELHGWAKLLEKDASAAARDGRIMLEFTRHEPLTRWNGWFLRMLAAEGTLFIGDKPKAALEARAALAMAPQHVHPGIQRYGRALAARILAWAGASDAALDLLEQLSTEYPMIGPAEVTRDPLYAIPLAGNARYRVLERKLEAEIAANQQWRDPD
jgi:TolB-like protein/DNA-binding winged helix-turn-helix (wHTH) protein/Tfp pilus assembly protein PilF